MTAKKKEPGMATLIIVLFAISAVTALLLGLVNYVTADTISKLAEEKAAKAMQEVLLADSYEQVTDFKDATGFVEEAYKAGNAGYVVKVKTTGSQGDIEMMIGVDSDGRVTGLSILSSAETAGLGAKAAEAGFGDRYVESPSNNGKASFAVDKDGGDIASITAATITSRAVCRGVNAAVAVATSIG